LNEIFGYKAGVITPALFITLISLMFGCLSETAKQPTDVNPQKPSTTIKSGITEQDDFFNLPGPPSDIRMIQNTENPGLQYQLVWKGTHDDTVSGYRLYQLDTQKNWSQIGFIQLRKEDSRNRGEYRFSKKIAADGIYSIAAVNNKSTAGPKSSAVQFDQQQPAPKD
jgi:hypothetical protein